MTEYGIKELKRRVKENKVLTFEERKYINKALEEIQQYRAMQERLKKVYGECDGLLEMVVSGLERHEDLELPTITVKSRLLTDECVDMWDAYRAIGTVEELQNMKDHLLMVQGMCKDYYEIGTIEEFKVLKEKSEPKEPIIIDNKLNEIEWKCPVCGLNVIEEPPCQEYCQRCGNKLDWSE